MENTTVSASIVLYNGFAQAEGCIQSVLDKTVERPLQLFLIDNASPDGSGAQLARRFGDVATVLQNPRNLGFGKGHNGCLPLLHSRYHAVINPDITLREDTLAVLCRYLDEHPEVAIVTPQLRFPDGRVQYTAKRPPNVLALASRQLGLRCLAPYENHYLMLERDLRQPQEVQFCSGCFFVIRTEVLQAIGGFDPGYFMYVEDADITRAAMRHGKAVYLPDSYVCHSWHRAAHRDPKAFLQQLRSMMRYFRKWGFCFGFGKTAPRLPDQVP